LVAIAVATALVLLLISSYEHDQGAVEFTIALGADVARFAFVGIVIASTWLYLRTEAEHVQALDRCAVDAARMDEQTAEARLQLLEAQIEPHFLFNTLATVRRLYEVDRPSGARMLANLKAYLANALPQMRGGIDPRPRGRPRDRLSPDPADPDGPQARLRCRRAGGVARGAHAFADARDAGRERVKHALSPLPEGGRIDIRATLADGRLEVKVIDNGRGFAKSSGGGTGLANIRARLATQFGTAARLSLALNAPTGVIATVELPCQQVETSSPS
jgi:signal transduction histidine kinase